MNKRIKELSVEAAYGVIDPNGPFTAEEFVSFEQKFAELIIRECAQYIEDKFDFCGDEIIIAEKLKEQFGIK